MPRPAAAEGSRTLYASPATCAPNSSNGSCRANIEWRTSFYGPAGSTQVRRRTIIQVFANSGETIALGSSTVGVGSGDIVVFDPSVITDPSAEPLPAVTTGVNGFKCSDQRTSSGIATQGQITSRALELAGPQAVSGGGNPSGYVPCHYTAPVTGIYSVVFYGPDGDGVDTDGGATADINLAAAANFNSSQLATIAAWDVTVRANDTSISDIDGRVFTTALAASTAGNGRPLGITFYVTTKDGFVYRVQTRGVDPNGFALYGNQLGYIDADGTGPLDHDIVGTTSSSQLTGLAGNATLAPPEYPISFGPLAPETLAALGIPATPAAPALSALSFVGSVGGNTSVVGEGGTFNFSTTTNGVVEIIISRDGVDFDPGNPLNRVLRVAQSAGAHTIAWDGNDNRGDVLPVGVGYEVRADVHAGEYHFPLLDAENSTLGGPTITMQNPPGGTCPFGNAACTTAFYDDRGYHTSGPSGSDVGTPGATLCGLSPPAVNHSDPALGYDSSGGQRAYGSDTGGNTNTPCTGSFGDVKGLDTWTYFPSATRDASLNVIGSSPAAPTATNDHYDLAYGKVLNEPAPGVLTNDTGTGITVTMHTNPAHGILTQLSDGRFTYTPATGYSGIDSYTYTITDSFLRTATATVTIVVDPAPPVVPPPPKPTPTPTVPPPGALPFTGADSKTLAALAMLLIAAGAAMVSCARPRRKREVSYAAARAHRRSALEEGDVDAPEHPVDRRPFGNELQPGRDETGNGVAMIGIVDRADEPGAQRLRERRTRPLHLGPERAARVERENQVLASGAELARGAVDRREGDPLQRAVDPVSLREGIRRRMTRIDVVATPEAIGSRVELGRDEHHDERGYHPRDRQRFAVGWRGTTAA